MDETDAGELSRIQQRIIDLSEMGLSRSRHHLLSELGIALGPDLQVLKRASGKRLVEFIRERLSDRYEIVRSGSHDSIYAIAWAEHHDERATGTEGSWGGDHGQPSSRPVRYNYRFWAAFSVPVASDIRLLNLETLTFSDSERPDVVPQGTAMIEREFITDEGVENRDQAIAGKIARWLESQQLSPSRFLDQTPRPVRRYFTDAAPRQLSVLEHVLECLDKAQLQRTTLSLDVVRALLVKAI